MLPPSDSNPTGYRPSAIGVSLIFMRIRNLLLTAFFLAPASLPAQDAQYWTYQYGTRATLLGGAVIGSVLDISAAFYNPGGLALIDDPELVATSRVIEASGVSIERQDDALFDLSQLRLDMAPGFFGGILPFSFLGDDHVLGYSMFTRYFMKSDLNSFLVGTAVHPVDSVAINIFGEFRLENRLSETWIGLTWSHQVSGPTGIGASLFVSSRSQEGESRSSLQGLTAGEAGAVSSRQNLYTYWNYGVLLKTGATFEYQKTSFGLTLTTPRLSVLGQGKMVSQASSFGQDLDLDGVPDPTFAAIVAEDLKATSKSSWAFGFGASRSFGNARIHLTAEYFTALETYDILPPQSTISIPGGDTVTVRVQHTLDDVLNVGAGVEYEVSPVVSTFLAFRTDFSAKRPGVAGDVSISSWDIFFGTVGVALTIGPASLNLGLAYGGGGDVRDIQDIKNQIPPRLGELLPDELHLSYRTMRFIFAFSI